MKAAQYLVNTLHQAGVRQVFGLAGTTILPILDAIANVPDVEYVSVRHEQVAAAMADGYARVTGTPGVCMAHVGPGVTNLMTSVAAAFHDSVPLVVITGNMERYMLGRQCWHEIDVMTMFRPIVKWQAQVTLTQHLPYILRNALMRAVSGRPGPVLVDIPTDVLLETIDAAPPLPELLMPAAVPVVRPHPDPTGIDGALRVMAEAKRPVLLLGGGVNWSGAAAAATELAETLQWPVITTDTGRGSLPEVHPLCIGPAGRWGMVTSCQALKDADVVLAIGCRFSDLTTLNWTLIQNQQIIQVDIDPGELSNQYPVAVAVMADAQAFCTGLTAALRAAPGRVPAAAGWVEELRGTVDEETRHFFAVRQNGQVQPTALVQTVMEFLQPDAMVAVGAGLHGQFADNVVMRAPRSYLCSVGSGAMGYAFPAAMGAKAAFPRRQCVCLVGDGDFAQVMQDFETCTRQGYDLVTVIFNNYSYGSQKARMAAWYDNVLGVDHQNPDFATFARGCGGYGIRVERPEELRRALAAAFGSGKPALVDVVIDPEAKPQTARL